MVNPWQVGREADGTLKPWHSQPASPPTNSDWQAHRQLDWTVPVWLPAGTGSQRAGYKIVLLDLPADATPGRVCDWICRDPTLSALPRLREAITDMTVSGGARSGAKKAIIVVSDVGIATQIYRAVQRWWLPDQAQARGYIWLGSYCMKK